MLCGWLESHGYAGAGSGLGSLVGLSEHPGPPRCQLSGLLLAFHLGQMDTCLWLPCAFTVKVGKLRLIQTHVLQRVAALAVLELSL